jgi:hypothetical protein
MLPRLGYEPLCHSILAMRCPVIDMQTRADKHDDSVSRGATNCRV